MDEGVAVDEQVGAVGREGSRRQVVGAGEPDVLVGGEDPDAGERGADLLDAVIAGGVVDDENPFGGNAVGHERSHRPDRVLGRTPVEHDDRHPAEIHELVRRRRYGRDAAR